MDITNVEVRCPICSEKGMIEVDKDELKTIERGLLAINVAQGSICDHTFIAYIDKNLNVRDCYIADFQIEVPQVQETTADTSEVQKLDIVKMNFS